ncbi:unnamed protein product [Durusdinium trenchii]|uniref:RING-type domain-containing protein n=1 Tax=Durusdinium trenchii TaxID=1381693 RepID=A0ABP0HU83_9DINO
MWRRRSRSPRRCESGLGDEDLQQAIFDDGRGIARLLGMSRPEGLLEARRAQLLKSGFSCRRSRGGRFAQAFWQFWKRLCRGEKPKEVPPLEKASRLLLACWAAMCSWDPAFVASDGWEQASKVEAKALHLVLPLLKEVPSLFGLFALLHVTDMAPDCEERWEVKCAIMRQMQRHLNASGATCPVCLEELGREPATLMVMPCSHAVHSSCYASAVRAKTSAGRCLMCRKVCNWSNIIISRLLHDYRGFILTMVDEEDSDWLVFGGGPPREFLVASICADLSEHLPYLQEVSMTMETLATLYLEGQVEVSPQGTWIVSKELMLGNRWGRGTLAGPGAEPVASKPPHVRLPVASSLVSIASSDAQVCYNEFQIQQAGAFSAGALFGLISPADQAVMTFKVPLPMQLFWSSDFHKSLESKGLPVCEDVVSRSRNTCWTCCTTRSLRSLDACRRSSMETTRRRRASERSRGPPQRKLVGGADGLGNSLVLMIPKEFGEKRANLWV